MIHRRLAFIYYITYKIEYNMILFFWSSRDFVIIKIWKKIFQIMSLDKIVVQHHVKVYNYIILVIQRNEFSRQPTPNFTIVTGFFQYSCNSRNQPFINESCTRKELSNPSSLAENGEFSFL